MKPHLFLLCYLIVSTLPSTSLGEAAFHPFVTTDGRSLNATIKEYNERSKKIQIKREDGKLIWVLPSVFCKADQEYIQQWIAVDQFMSPTKFKIKGKKYSGNPSSKYGYQYSHRVKEEEKSRVVYEITLENKTGFPLKDIRIEYQAFIFKKTLNRLHGDQKDSYRAEGGLLQFATIPAGKTISKKTNPIGLITQFKSVIVHSGEFDASDVDLSSRKSSTEQLEGVWLKVYGPMIDGSPAIREWCSPSDISKIFTWQSITQIVPKKPRLPAAKPSRKDQELIKEAYRYRREHDQEKSLELFQEAYKITQSPITAADIGEQYIWHLKPPNIPLGLEWLEKAANQKHSGACLSLVQFYTTYKDPKYRDTKKAIEYGQQAVSIRKDYYMPHNRLAAAYAIDGQFKKAILCQKQAIGLYREQCSRRYNYQTYLATMEATLELYKKGKVE